MQRQRRPEEWVRFLLLLLLPVRGWRLHRGPGGNVVHRQEQKEGRGNDGEWGRRNYESLKNERMGFVRMEWRGQGQ